MQCISQWAVAVSCIFSGVLSWFHSASLEESASVMLARWYAYVSAAVLGGVASYVKRSPASAASARASVRVARQLEL